MSRKLLVLALEDASIPADSKNVDTILIGAEGDLEKKMETVEQNAYDEVRVYFLPSESIQGSAFSALKPKAKICIENIPDRSTGQDLSLNLRIQGFVDIMAAKDPGTGSRFVVCQKPDVEVGSTAKLSLPMKSAVKITQVADDDLIDEDALLAETEEDVRKLDTMDCGPDSSRKRRACANCTCGLADKEKAGQGQELSEEEKVSKSSACGNCYKGDAFRCASCPFLGKPAFEAGMEKVVLSMGNDDI